MKTYIKFSCIYCGQHIECEPEYQGRQFHCPACHQRLAVPRAAEQKAADLNHAGDATWDTMVPDPHVETPTRYLRRDGSQLGS